MDLKSVKEKKAMLSEASLIENLMYKLPFEIPFEDGKNTARSNLDKLSTICRVVKPHSVETIITAVRSVEVDMEYFKLKKFQQLKNTEAEIRDLKCKILQMPTLHAETASLADELQLKNSRLDDVGKFTMDHVPDSADNGEVCAVHAKEFADLSEDFKDARKLQSENDALKRKLKSIPVEPGFDFSKDSLQNLLAQKLLQLEELKSQVLYDSMAE